MKIRLQSGSVRFRLRQTEVRALVATGRADEAVWLGKANFVNSLQLHEGVPALTLDGPTLVARIPAEDVRRWASGDAVGLSYTLPEGTRLLVEKDWACLEPVAGESNDDTFARPAAPSMGRRTP